MYHVYAIGNTTIYSEILNGRPPLLRSRHRRKDNTKMDLKYIYICCVEWIYLVQDRIND
jgi:hypothetical protein